MAIAGNTIAYISSSAYYGYVPAYVRDDRAIDDLHDKLVDRVHGSAMETDEDDERMERMQESDASSSSWWCRARSLQQDNILRQGHHPTDHHLQEQTPRPINRKRSYGDDEVDRRAKRLREGSAKYQGLATVRYESTLLCLDTIGYHDVERTSLSGRCCWAAGNRSSISNADCKGLLSRDTSNESKSSAEYERMLFETHGCSAYHHRQQMENEDVESEF